MTILIEYDINLVKEKVISESLDREKCKWLRAFYKSTLMKDILEDLC